MAIINDTGTGMYMPVAPAYGGGYGNGSGFFGGDWAWIILLLLIGGGGWGLGGFGGGMLPMMMDGMGGFGLDYLYPWLNNSQHISDGFRDQQLNTQIGDLRSDVNRGFGDVQLGLSGLGRQICETGNGVTGAVRDGFYGAEIAANQRQMANMQGLNGLQAQLAQCCCDNRLATESLRATVLSENCADRYEAANNTRDIIDAIRGGNQGIMDKLCQLELDNVRAERDAERRNNENLRTDLLFARGQASQEAQSTSIVQRLLTEMRSCPVPSQPVYGNQPIFSCYGNNNPGCGCGGNYGFAA